MNISMDDFSAVLSAFGRYINDKVFTLFGRALVLYYNKSIAFDLVTRHTTLV